ncbi:MAG: hypothetical protein R2932_39260 [Caldilineaceae bacterium]
MVKPHGATGWRAVRLALFVLLLLCAITACRVTAPAASPLQTQDDVRPIEDRLQQAFALIPEEIANQDFSGFQQYVATPAQGADANGLNEIYTWLQAIRLKGNAPAATATYKLNELRITNVQTRGYDATAHVSIDISKLANGNEPDAAVTVEQNIALVQVNGQWLINGADQAQITDLLTPPK